ncbi:PiggyBac transposable element-derived protein 4-like isoform x1 [Plakobranchus ocellatus]|uniref:PiggyBac transposable element-derived protein 4-like isoform x1 n=1 Tax=Plakobranchus ocellatus TaxID=259542 RepID=A0AAV3ZTL4_9GAST|nr:PiggyBac transposable element-derived protein 4-like isoform x1 [Plakobranchus ocellatus]
MEECSATASDNSDIEINSASEPEEDDDPIYKRWRERRKPKKLTYRGVCTSAGVGSKVPWQFANLQLHPSEVDNLNVPVTPGALFKLFFTPELVASICDLTNANAESQKDLKPDLYEDWVPITPEEFYRFLALLLFMTVVRVHDIKHYWSESLFFQDMWSQRAMSMLRYRQIQGFLKVSEPEQGRVKVSFSEVDSVYESIREKCLKMWEVDKNGNQKSLPLEQVKDAVIYFWEGLDEETGQKGKRKALINIKKTDKGWLLLEGFGKTTNVQWKDREVASALMIKHKDLQRGVLKFLRYKKLDNSEFGGAFGAAEDYGSSSAHMMVGENDVLISTTKSWKVVFYHLIDVAWLSSYLLFEQYRSEPEQAFNPHVARLSSYKATNFMTDLFDELGGLPEDPDRKKFCCTELLPDIGTKKERCAFCCKVEKLVRMTNAFCRECLEYFCFDPERNCLAFAHGK